MRACDTCPGKAECAAENLHPILLDVHRLHCDGAANKFEILFALDDEAQALLERYNHRISADCWAKAALLAIADIVARSGAEDLRQALAGAVDAYSDFPWAVAELVEQAPDLYEAILFRAPGDGFADAISKRQFVKTCRAVAYR